MLDSFRQLDQILRGEATQLSKLRDGQIELPVRGLLIAAVVLAMVYGAFMGSFAVIRTGGAGEAWMQLVASMVKLPVLFLLTLLVTLPSLYVFNALVGSRLTMQSVARLLVAMLGVMLAVLASLGPIVAFFGVSTTSYVFMKLLNVTMAAVAGFLGLAFLVQTLHRLVMAQNPPPPVPEEPAEPTQPPPIPTRNQNASAALVSDDALIDRRAKLVFRIWIVVFGFVGAQMSWVLRPFIGSPELPFTWFRARESNFFLDVMQSIGQLLGA